MKSVWLICFLILASAFSATCRTLSTSILILSLKRSGGWSYLDRMMISRGEMLIKFILQTPYYTHHDANEDFAHVVQLAIIEDSDWKIELANKCNPKDIRPGNLSKSIYSTLKINNNFKNTTEIVLSIPQDALYHFVLKNCDQSLTKQSFSRDAKIDVELTVLNNGNFTALGEQKLGYFYPLIILAVIVMLRLTKKPQEDDQQGYVRPLFRINLWLNLFALLSKYIGYLIYANLTGRDYPIFDFLYLLLQSAADAFVTSLLIMLIFGWTILFKRHIDFDIYAPLVAMLGLVHVILTVLNKITDYDHDKYHMYDAVPAYIMLGFRCITLIIFLVGLIITIVTIDKDHTITNYFVQLACIGGNYIIMIPLLMYIVNHIQPGQRKVALFVSFEVTKQVLCAFLAYLLTHNKSTYRRILQRSFFQQGAKVL